MHRAPFDANREGSRWGRPGLWTLLTVLAPISLLAQPSSLPWRWSNPRPHGNNVYDLAFRDGWYWLACDRGQLYAGTNRFVWTAVPTGTTRALRGVTFFGDQVIVCGEEGTVLRGTLAGSFQPSAVTPATTDWLEGVAASSTTLVAVGDNAAVYRSTDGGATWQRVNSLPFSNWLLSVAWGGNTFVTVGESGLIATSADGQSWRRRTSNVNTSLNRVVYQGGRFYAVGENGVLLSSANLGANWTRESLGITNTLYAYAQAGTASGTPRLVAGESALWLKSSPTGGWTNQLGADSLLPAPTWDYFGAVWDGDRFFVAGRTGLMVESLQTNVSSGSTTYEGTLWFEESDSPRDWLWDVLALPGLYIAVGDRAQVVTSENGADWWSETVPSAVTNAVFLGVGGSSKLVVAAGSEGALMFSESAVTHVTLTNTVVEFVNCAWTTNTVETTNAVNLLGVRWTAVEPRPGTNALQGVCERAGRFVVAGDFGTVLTSTNASDWSATSLPGQPHLSAVAAGDPGFVATGSRGAIWFSPDAGEWSPRVSGTTNWIYRVAWVNGGFVAVGQNGTLLASPDGLAWTPRASGTTAWLTDVAYAAGRYFVCGTQGTVLVSSNAVDWASVGTITGKSLYGLATRNSQLVTVGVEGVILRALLDTAAPVQIASYDHEPCPDARVDRFRFRGHVDQSFTLEASEDLRVWQAVGEFGFDYEEFEHELVRTSLAPAAAEYFRARLTGP
jgi:photosystem II stability/assembly factor-like uncharacterized protein